MSPGEVALRLMFATVLGAAIGWERERKNHPAGLRTHILVSLGSALVMLVSIGAARAAGGASADPTRIAAQVVSGIGFLGAGTILREGLTIRGLTTAASLWLAAGLGLAAGAGFYLEASLATAIGLVTLAIFSTVEDRLFGPVRAARLTVAVRDEPGQLGRVAEVLGRHRVDIRQVHLESQGEEEVEISLTLRAEPGADVEGAVRELASLPGLRQIRRE
ncbi:MAG: MgtC/SapB family protein [Clostridia bacterium]|nr:MgtC/SapB family protein [Clostridia bacterium]